MDALSGKPPQPFIVYLQAGTGTYASPDAFRHVVESVFRIPGAIGLFIGTRPDCLNGSVLDVLNSYRGRKLLWLELGLQSSSDLTLDRVGRGHDVEAFVRARSLAMERGIPICAHIILGLPDEGKEEMMSTARFLAEHRVEGVKIHHLQIIRGTRLEEEYHRGQVKPLDHNVYAELVSEFLEHLPSTTVIHRLLSDAPDEMLVAPKWPQRSRVIQSIRDHMMREGSFQGKAFRD
jgi:radical SAM protein (TIGR01212 family)